MMGTYHKLACIDLEGVLVPELWPRIAVYTDIQELFTTTREFPDYGALMRRRISLLRQYGITLGDVQRITQAVDPLAGAEAFLQGLESNGYLVNIVSDCFQELAAPLLRKLGDPITLCHRLYTDHDGFISGCDYFPRKGKEDHVRKGLASGFEVIAVGDAFNDINMLRMATHGFLINPSTATLDAATDLKTVSSLEDVLRQIST